MAKGVASGYAPISCTVTTEKVFQDFVNDPADTDAYFRDISTFGGCTSVPPRLWPTSKSSNVKTCSKTARRWADRLLEGLKGLMAKHPITAMFAARPVRRYRNRKVAPRRNPLLKPSPTRWSAPPSGWRALGKTSRSFREFTTP